MTIPTVSRWIDKGLIEAYRTPGGHRRVTPKAIQAFMVDQGIALDAASAPDAQGIPLLILAHQVEKTERLRKGLGPRFHVEVVSNEFEAGRLWERLRPEIVVLDTRGTWRETLSQIRALEDQPTLILGWPKPEAGEGEGDAPTFDGFIPARSTRIEAIRSRVLMAYLDAWMAARS